MIAVAKNRVSKASIPPTQFQSISNLTSCLFLFAGKLLSFFTLLHVFLKLLVVSIFVKCRFSGSSFPVGVKEVSPIVQGAIIIFISKFILSRQHKEKYIQPNDT